MTRQTEEFIACALFVLALVLAITILLTRPARALEPRPYDQIGRSIEAVGEDTDYERGYSDALAEANAWVNRQAQLTKMVDSCWRTGGQWTWPVTTQANAGYCYRAPIPMGPVQ